MRAVVIGSGIGGLACAIRLAAQGHETVVYEAMDQPGGRAAVLKDKGFTFDMGPTVLTVPHFIEELFALQPGDLSAPDFPREVLERPRIRTGVSGGEATEKYVNIVPILPFYRIYFDDGTFFDYDGDPQSTTRQIRAICPEDLEGYERFHQDAKAIFERGFLELGYTHFGDPITMLSVLPDLLKLDAVRSLFSFTSRYFTSDKLRQVFSFETLLVGGNPLRVPAIYAMIHFVEKTWGIHFAMGGTGALVQAMVRKLEELGGKLHLGQPIGEIVVTDAQGKPARRRSRTKQVRGVRLTTGDFVPADIVVSNADYGHTCLKLLSSKVRPLQPDILIKRGLRWSMSLLVVYFGFKDDPENPLDLRHHNIILGPRYEALLTDIFDRKILAKDFSQYLHIPTLTDPSLAPEGHHAAYTLIPVPHNGSGIDWDVQGPRLTERVMTFLEEEGYIPNLRERVVVQHTVDPNYFQHTLNAHLGNGFGLEPRLSQSAWFRPHNRFKGITGLYLAGASAQPGAGTPSVMMSAKMTARLVAEDYPRV